MSHDLFLYRSDNKIPDVDEASEVIDNDNDKWARKPYNLQTKMMIENALLKADSTLMGFDYEGLSKNQNKTVEDIRKSFMHFELRCEKPDIEIKIFDNHVEIIVPFLQNRELAAKAFEKINKYITVVFQVAEYFVYDPQSGEAFNPSNIPFDGLQKYLSVY